MNNQQALIRFLDNGKIGIDNNAAERAIRSITIGAKSAFSGSGSGGHTASIIYSIIDTAKLNTLEISAESACNNSGL